MILYTYDSNRIAKILRIWLLILAMCVVFLVSMLFPILVFAEDGTPDFTGFMTAITTKHWPLAVAIGVTLAVWIIRMTSNDWIPRKYIPRVLLGCTVVAAVASRMIQALTSGSSVWYEAMIQGLMEGLSIALPAMGISSVAKSPSSKTNQ